VLFVGRSELAHLPRILQQIRGTGVLTVSDIEDFARKGGIVGFFNQGGRVRLEINAVLARQAGLKLSAKLLEISRIVGEGR
jgi:hypothetical protein